MLMRYEGDYNVRALRLCNYSEWYNKNQNQCVPCRSDATTGERSFPLQINSDKCLFCDDVEDLSNSSDQDSKDYERIKYLCENSDNYPLGKSSQSHVPFFKIGQEIPADVLDWDIKVETDISENKHLEEKEE